MEHAELARLSSLSQIIDLAYDELIGISVLGPLWRDDDITEILVDGWNKITIEKDGALQTTGLRFRDKEHARKIARDMALKVSDRALTPASPLVTAELPGARVAFAIDKVVKSDLSISMRKFRPLMDMDGLLRAGALNEEMRDFLSDCIQARANVLVSGGTGTGKTTMINALSTFIPHSERVITIEDAYELALDTPHWVALQTKESSSADDEIVISMADLLVTTLRMRPDRIIVGEIREPRGASVMLQAANTGHDGTMTTIHANSADRALNFRMVGFARTGSSMTAEVAAAEVSSAINLVIQVVRRAGRRFISEIAVVDPSMLHSGLISPVHIFKGELIDGKPSFKRYGAVNGDTEIGMKLEDKGLLGKWDL
jgi:pilus assembly protein CpaF